MHRVNNVDRSDPTTLHEQVDPYRLEANAAATVAVALVKGTTPKTTAKVSGTPSVLLTPIWLTKHNYKKVFTDGFLKKSAVCTGKYAQFCK